MPGIHGVWKEEKGQGRMTENFRNSTYRLLVNRIPGIRARYTKMRGESSGTGGRLRCLAALAWWNFSYYCLRRRELLCPVSWGYYERRRQKPEESENPEIMEQSVLISKLKNYDVISFDIFDTLLLRPFSEPAALFYFLEMHFSYPDLHRIRREAEDAAREKKGGAGGEVTLSEIWSETERMTGIPAERGMEAEQRLEQKYCLANPYFLPVVKALRESGRRLIVISDMYLGADFLRDLLERKGLGKFDACFVSSEYRDSKHRGGLYRIVKRKMQDRGAGTSYVHVGDNVRSDYRMARREGFDAFVYPNPQSAGNLYRPADMSPITGSMYRGIVNIRLHSGEKKYDCFYEYGYIYGGILALGYCRFIHRYVKEKKIERIWFLSRDGEILKRVYGILYPEEKTDYVFWSRNAAARLLSDVYRYDFFCRFLFQKVNQGYCLEQIFSSMELEDLLDDACRQLKCGREERLTEELACRCRDYLISVWNRVSVMYSRERLAAAEYFKRLAAGSGSAAAVDIGWAGSGASALDRMMNQALHLPFRVYGLVMGTCTANSPFPDVSEGLFFSGQMESYLFSQKKNRDLWKFHDPGRKHNLYLELLFTSAAPSFRGFGTGKNRETVFRFGRREAHGREILRIQKGILDYVEDYRRYFPDFLSEGRGGISGRDAYAPMQLFLGDRRAQKRLEQSFFWDTDQNVE